jgi:hypothetical protein
MMPMPDLVRSSQLSMPLGLPLRTTSATTDVVQMPALSPSFHEPSTMPASTSRVMSGSSEKWTRSAGCPASTARLWSPEAPYDSWKVVPFPASVAWKPEMTPLLASWRTE